jgi:hypothetical protein
MTAIISFVIGLLVGAAIVIISAVLIGDDDW